MKYLPLIWAGIWRKRSRAVLMLLQIASAFLLFGLLQGVNSGIKESIARTHSERLYVASSVSFGVPLPMSMLPQIRSIPGVKAVTPFVIVPGQYQRQGQGVPIWGVDPEQYFRLAPEVTVPKEQLEALIRNRTGALIGATTAERFGFKVGDRLTLQSQLPRRDGTNAWAFDIVGIFRNTEQANGSAAAMVNFDYVNEARLADRDTSLFFLTLAESEKAAPALIETIDKAFANSSTETRTQSEGDMFAAQLQRIADIDLVVGGIVSAVFFALMLATGALMMQSIRERVPELAVLKTLGFSDKLVMILILVEAVIFCVFSASVGLGLAALILPAARSLIGIAGMPTIVIVMGLGFAVALALIGGSVPAWRGLRLRVAEALRG